MPKDPYDRAIARFWAAFVDDKMIPCIRGIFWGPGEQQQKEAEELVASFLIVEEALRTNRCFSGKPYFGGDEIGLVDIALGGILAFVKALEKATNLVLIDQEKMPLLDAWSNRFCDSNGVKEVMPDPVKLREFIAAWRVKNTSPPAAN
jgi:glutathione S-transferase